MNHPTPAQITPAPLSLAHFERQYLARLKDIHDYGECLKYACPWCRYERQWRTLPERLEAEAAERARMRMEYEANGRQGDG